MIISTSRSLAFWGTWPGVLGGVWWRGTILINNLESGLHNHTIIHHSIRSGRATNFNLNLMSNTSLFYFQRTSSLSLIHYHPSFHYSTSKVSSDSDSDSDSWHSHSCPCMGREPPNSAWGLKKLLALLDRIWDFSLAVKLLCILLDKGLTFCKTRVREALSPQLLSGSDLGARHLLRPQLFLLWSPKWERLSD